MNSSSISGFWGVAGAGSEELAEKDTEIGGLLLENVMGLREFVLPAA